MQVLRFIPHPQSGAVYFREELTLDHPHDLEKVTEGTMPAALVIRSAHLSQLARFQDLVVDRGVKHQAKGLSTLLLGQSRFPLIDGRHRAPGQLKRSVRTLLKNAVAQGERNLYLIGAGDQVFGGLWQEAAEPYQALQGVAAVAGANLSFTARLLLELEGRLEVPEELRQTFIGESDETRLVRTLIMLAGKGSEPVLITGDTGTGKEVAARAIYQFGDRAGKGFVAVNCAGIPRELLETELFGHAKGAFTDAASEKTGLWEEAGEGILFLDEIGDLQPAHQAKILRALEAHEIKKVGGNQNIKVAARVVAATNRDLYALVKAGRFREDLYYRLRGFLIRTPALREHPQDIPLLAQHLWRHITQDPARTLPREIVSQLKDTPWPGNVRQLKMVLNRLHDYFGVDGLTREHLRWVFLYEGQTQLSSQGPGEIQELTLHRVECLRHLRRADEVIRATEVTLHRLASEKEAGPEGLEDAVSPLSLRLNELEILCLQPLLFFSEGAFAAVHRLKGRLMYLLNLLQARNPEAVKYYQRELADEFSAVQSVLFKEVGGLMVRG